jgi:hypothetical protein
LLMVGSSTRCMLLHPACCTELCKEDGIHLPALCQAAVQLTFSRGVSARYLWYGHCSVFQPWADDWAQSVDLHVATAAVQSQLRRHMSGCISQAHPMLPLPPPPHTYAHPPLRQPRRPPTAGWTTSLRCRAGASASSRGGGRSWMLSSRTVASMRMQPTWSER